MFIKKNYNNYFGVKFIIENKTLSNKTHDDNVHTYGLGLSFCKLAIEAHQGKIGVISEAPQGVVFWFSLPEAKQEMSINPEFPIKWDNLKISQLGKNL